MSKNRQEGEVSRREVLGKLASAVFAGLVAPAVMGEVAAVAEDAPETTVTIPAPSEWPALPEPALDENPLIRMMRDLQGALQKPAEERRWGMVIDLRKCVGCHACTVSCVAENKLPPGVVYRPVLDQEIGTFPNVTRRFMPRPCLQCDEPPCVPVCPVGATWKRSDGIVTIDYDQCIGCRYCITACPYSARTFDSGHTYTEDTPEQQMYEMLPAFEYGESRARDGGSPIGNARKCHFCVHRLERGELPMCVTTCIGMANFFGDLNDPDSLVSEMAAKPNVFVLKEELGTKPKVFYLL
ncbi:MAG: 4Fe-4S dicluster domain-containing protein [Anaerolineae bacterium]